MKMVWRLFSLLVIPVAFCLNTYAQDVVRNQLFGNADDAVHQAKERNADFYAQKLSTKGSEYYRDADEKYRSGGNLDEIREKLKQATDAFTKAAEIGKQAALMFSRVIVAKSDANSAGAPNYSAELWKNGEEKFREAARKFEDGNIEDAKKTGSEAETAYRSAELEAIKANFLSPARTLLQRADEIHVGDNAPKTLQKAKMLSARVDSILKQNRYNTDDARQVAQEAKYEASHAIYLHQTIQGMKEEDKSYEDAILTCEMHFERVAKVLGVQPRFDVGFNGPATEMIAAVKSRDAKIQREEDSIRQLTEYGRQKDNEIDNLHQQIAAMETRLGSLTENEKALQKQGEDLQQQLIIKQQQEETIRQVAATFTPEEGSLIRDGEDIVLRLYGLSFPSGKSDIESEYYPLLTRVQDAIKKFPNSKVTIEGHTDSQGSVESNQTLSENRAKAVAEYLMANMGVALPINSQGYGDSRPVASNETPEGRAKNRRIDVVITPEWAKTGK